MYMMDGPWGFGFVGNAASLLETTHEAAMFEAGDYIPGFDDGEVA